MGLWSWLYEKPRHNKFVNQTELNYIEQDNDIAEVQNREQVKEEKVIPFFECFKYKQTWSFLVGKFMTDGVWWFFLFWAPAYFSDQYGYTSDSTMGILLIFTLYAIVTIGLLGAGHQAWSANLFSTIGDMFPKSTIGTIVGLGTMAGGIGSMSINWGSGKFFDWAADQGANFAFFGFDGKPAAYMVVFCICSVAYLIGWCIMKTLVPKYKPIEV